MVTTVVVTWAVVGINLPVETIVVATCWVVVPFSAVVGSPAVDVGMIVVVASVFVVSVVVPLADEQFPMSTN